MSENNIFTPDDILAAVALIDHACQAGAYRGWDIINSAYSVRSRLLEFANSWQSIYATPESQESTETLTPTESE